MVKRGQNGLKITKIYGDFEQKEESSLKIMLRQMWKQYALVVFQLQKLKPACNSCHKYQFVKHGFRLNMDVTAELFSLYFFLKYQCYCRFLFQIFLKCHNFQFWNTDIIQMWIFFSSGVNSKFCVYLSKKSFNVPRTRDFGGKSKDETAYKLLVSQNWECDAGM